MITGVFEKPGCVPPKLPSYEVISHDWRLFWRNVFFYFLETFETIVFQMLFNASNIMMVPIVLAHQVLPEKTRNFKHKSEYHNEHVHSGFQPCSYIHSYRFSWWFFYLYTPESCHIVQVAWFNANWWNCNILKFCLLSLCPPHFYSEKDA